jgi:hypothetical protein
MGEIDTLGNLATGDTEKDSAASVAARRAVCFQGKGGFLRIRGLDKDELIFPNLIQNAHSLPHADD